MDGSYRNGKGFIDGVVRDNKGIVVTSFACSVDASSNLETEFESLLSAFFI